MPVKTWKKTEVHFLGQHRKYGTYYARFHRDGKQHWKSLETEVFSVAQAALAAYLQDFRSNAPATLPSASLLLFRAQRGISVEAICLWRRLRHG